MSGPLKGLSLGRDPDLFASAEGAPNDTHQRHVLYVEELQRRRPGSEVRAIVHTRRPAGKRHEQPMPGFDIYGTFSRSRLHCPIDMARLMIAFDKEGWVPDAISCQTGYEEGPLALLLARRQSKVQIQIHNDFYGDAFASEKLLQRVQRAGIRWAIRRCDHARVVSSGIESALVSSGDIELARISVAPVPIAFEAAPHQDGVAPPVVLFVGRLVPQKDLGLWCDVAATVHRTYPDAEFWVVGGGPDRALVEQRSGVLGGKLKLLGELRYSDLAPIYARSSVFLLTSLYEGLGRVIVEAMLTSVPVVSADIVGPRDLIIDYETGRLVPRTTSDLANAVVKLLDDPELARTLGTNGKQWAEQNYNFEVVAEKLVESWEVAAALPKRRP